MIPEGPTLATESTLLRFILYLNSLGVFLVVFLFYELFFLCTSIFFSSKLPESRLSANPDCGLLCQ